MRGRSSEAGFVLVEILAVLAIMAIVAAIVAPLLRAPPLTAQLRADTMRFAAVLRLTRAAAMARSQAQDVHYDPGRGQLASTAGPAVTLDRRIETNRADPQLIRFFPSGRATGGAIRLRTATQATRIDVVWATGDIRIGP